MNISSQRPMRRRAALRAGFTLIEIMIVVMIIGLLAAIAIPNISVNIARARKQAIISNLRVIENAKVLWAANNKKGEGDTVEEKDIAPELNGGKMPSKIMGEQYNLNPIGTRPTATVPSKLLDTPAGGEVTIPD